jgi:transcriptional regulator with PAS, ATPase and Fis domain
MTAGRFREDLFYRLNVIELQVPPLGDRPEDVIPLAERFLRDLSPAPTGTLWRLTPEARETLVRHRWPGNVRELENVLRRAVLVAAGDTIGAGDLGLTSLSEISAGATGELETDPGNDLLLADRIKIERALAEAEGVVAKAAEILGISRQALYRKMERHGLAVERRLRG